MNNTRTSVKHFLFQLFVLFVISSTVFAGRIQLAWDSPPEPVSGYRLYHGLSSGNYTKNMDVGKVATYTLTGLQDGQTYYIAVMAYNDSGKSNYSNEVFCVPEPDDTTPPPTRTPDTIAPTVTITQPTSEGSYSTSQSTLTVGGSASDNIGVTSVTWINSRGGSGTASGTDNWTISNVSLQEGDNVITVTAHDTAGNSGVDILTVTYILLDMPLSYNWIQAESKNITSPLETVSDPDVSAGAYIWKPSGSGDTTTPDGVTEYTIDISIAGDYVIWGRVIAPDGGCNSFFTSIDGGEDLAWGIQIGSVWTWDSVNGNGQDPLVFNLAAGTHTLKISGREDGTKLDRILITNDIAFVPSEQNPDNVPPPDVSNFTASIGDASINLTWTNPTDSDFAGTMIRYSTESYPLTRNDGIAVPNDNDGIFPKPIDNFLHSGLQNYTRYYYSSFVYDEVPNYTETAHASATPTPTSDAIVPTVTITQPTSEGSYSTSQSTLTVGGSASNNIGVTGVTWINSRGGSGTASGTDNWTISNVSLQEGDNVITVTAHDAAGNSGIDTLTVTYTLPDTTDPTVTITSPTSADAYSTEQDAINLGGSASDNIGVTSVTWINSRGGSGTASGTDNWTVSNVSLQEGDNVITVTAHNADGNTGVDILTVTYILLDMPLSYNWFQAESENITSPLETVSDSDASAGAYIWKCPGSGDSGTPDGVVEYTIDIPTTGEYVIWGRVIAPDGGCNSFFTSIDGGEHVAWHVQIGSVWTWDSVNGNGQNPLILNLAAGIHTLRISGREDGTKLDRLLITNDMAFVPSEENPDNVPPHAVRNLRIE